MRRTHTIQLCEIVAAVTALLSAACGLRGELAPIITPTPSAANLLQNGGFETGDSPWQLTPSGGAAAQVSGVRAHGGTNALSVRFSSAALPAAGASQTVSGTAIPEFVSGFYRVDQWRPDGATEYEEFVVTVRGGGFADGAAEHTLHFAIAGAPRAPANAATDSFVFLSRDPPKMGVWTYFGYPVAQAFESRFGAMQTAVDGVTIAFDVAAEGTTPHTSGEVYFDDLYAGPQAANPNRPVDE